MSVTYRNQTEAPTEPGTYYGRFSDERFHDRTSIKAMEVIRTSHRLLAYRGGALYHLGMFAWFGPATEVREG